MNKKNIAMEKQNAPAIPNSNEDILMGRESLNAD
jgi:hypothetical protein